MDRPSCASIEVRPHPDQELVEFVQIGVGESRRTTAVCGLARTLEHHPRADLTS
jgi:hypothetical protein